MESMSSRLSSASHMSDAFSSLDLTDRSGSQLQLSLANNQPANDSVHDHSEPVTVIEPVSSRPEDASAEQHIPIGTPLDQSLVHYTIRLVSSRFLLTGRPGRLVANDHVRVSIKNLALLVVAGCVRLDPDALLMPVMIHISNPKVERPLPDSNDSTEAQTVPKVKDELSICIIDNHFAADTAATDPSRKISVETIPSVHSTNASKRDEYNIYELRTTAESVGETIEYTQRMYDVLLFFAESDPMIRGNCVVIAENFVRSVLDGTAERDVDEFLKRRLGSEWRTLPVLSLNGLIGLILEVSRLCSH